jgi:hypothetical protein
VLSETKRQKPFGRVTVTVAFGIQAMILAVNPDNALYSPRSTFHELKSLQQMSPVLGDNTVTQAFSHPRTASATLSQKNDE